MVVVVEPNEFVITTEGLNVPVFEVLTVITPLDVIVTPARFFANLNVGEFRALKVSLQALPLMHCLVFALVKIGLTP